eukprot:8478058-Karenia_brevis.AAC.1
MNPDQIFPVPFVTVEEPPVSGCRSVQQRVHRRIRQQQDVNGCIDSLNWMACTSSVGGLAVSRVHTEIQDL